MKKVNWPKFKLAKHERLWLETSFERAKRHEYPDYRSIRIELLNSIPNDFNPNTIDARLGGYKGTNITLLGVYTLSPKNDIIDKINIIFKFIKDKLLVDPNLTEFKSVDISHATNIAETDVGLALRFANQYGRFWISAGYTKGYGYESIRLDGTDDQFDTFLYFNCFEDVLNEYFKIEEEKEQKNKLEKLNYEPEYNVNSEELILNPIFRSRVTHVDLNLCFVLMPFTEQWSNRIYKSYIRENIEALGYQCLRADNLVGQIIIEDIWIKINQAAFIIADVTNRNPNVMYELGIAHTIGKPVILITQDITTIPFDFSHLRHYVYEDNSDGKENFSIELKRIIPEIFNEFYN